MRNQFVAISFSLLLSCQGEIVSPIAAAPPVEAGWTLRKMSCSNAAQASAGLPLRRLTRTQYVNAVNDTVRGSGLTAAGQSAALASVSAVLSRYPSDAIVAVRGEAKGGFERLDQSIQQGQIDVSYELANALGRALTSNAEAMTGLMGTCASDASSDNDAKCLNDFIARFGSLALRRPPTLEDLTFYASTAGQTPVAPAAVADVVALLLTSPQFLYFGEEADPAGGASAPLDGYAIASRLSFQFWNSMPDAELFAAAKSGALLTAAGRRTQALRLFNDPRAEKSIREFFAQWFRLQDLMPLNTLAGTPLFDAFAGANSPSATLHEEMKNEIGDLVLSVARSGAPLGELLTNRKNFARTSGLSALYGQRPWDGVGPPDDLVEPQRAGLLTRGAFVASSTANTRPVIKGYRIRNALLCQPIPPPPASAKVVTPDLSPDLSTREVIERLTERSGTSCLGCHGSLLNAMGFATENFDSLGRHRTAQRLFNSDGSSHGERPIDTSGVPHLAGVETPVAGIAEVTSLMLKGDFQTCFARQYFRFTFQRNEDDVQDSCALAELQTGALSNAPLSELMLSPVLRPEFVTRTIQ